MISSSLVFVAVIKENNLGKKECVWHTGSSPRQGKSGLKFKAGSWRQELKQKP